MSNYSANLPIPGPSNEVAQTNDPSHVPAAIAMAKLLVPTNALSPRLVHLISHVIILTICDSNLFAIDYIKEHPGTKVDEFKEVWRNVENNDKVTLKVGILDWRQYSTDICCRNTRISAPRDEKKQHEQRKQPFYLKNYEISKSHLERPSRH